LKYLTDKNYYSYEIGYCAAYHDHFDAVKFCYDVNPETIDRAREHGCRWNATTCKNTISNYHFNALKWLRGIDRDKYILKSNETEICP